MKNSENPGSPQTYSILIEKQAIKEARKIPHDLRSAIDKSIQSLASNPRQVGSQKLTGKGGYRIREGNYRILYTIDDETKTVVVYRIKARGESTYK